jgi:hypothetical protein
MNYFTEIPEGQVIVHSGGVYRQAPLYARKDAIYARFGSGYVRLSIGGATSAPKVRWSEYEPGAAEIEEKNGCAPRLVKIHDQPKVRAAE